MNTHYDYYKGICLCPPKPVILGLGDENCNEIDEWPVKVINVNGEEIGTAATKQQYITIWNSDAYNNQVGTLYNFFGPFSFLLLVRPGQLIPTCLNAGQSSGVYAFEYAIQYQ